MELLLVAAMLGVAFANGANDNFKGVATLFGSGTADYRRALGWATATTLAGSLAAFFLAGELVTTFSGKGLVPDAVGADPRFLLAVSLGAGCTVLASALLGIPVSTTHALFGALVGGGLVAAGAAVNGATLLGRFLLPLLVSPLAALVLAAVLHPCLRRARLALGVEKSTCLCVGTRRIPLAAGVAAPGLVTAAVGSSAGASDALRGVRTLDVLVDERATCDARTVEVYAGRLLGVDAGQAFDALHYLSAGAVGFARGLNDTPKIVALAVAGAALGLRWNVGLAALAMALGGLCAARRVAETMAKRITTMNPGQGLAANLVTAFLVIFASRWGLPVSTTHVSCGSLFGLGLANRSVRWKVVGGIVSAWVLTLPLAALSSAGVFLVLGAVLR